MQGLTVGRIVHYVLQEGRNAGQPRAAMVVRVLDSPVVPDGVVNLHVMLDGLNDAGAENQVPDHMSAWVTSVHYSEEPKPGTWHWPPRA